MLFKVDVLKSFANFTRKHKCWSLFLRKLQAWRPATLWKTRLQHWCLLVKFAKFLRTLVFTEHLRWLLLVYDNSRMTSSCTQLFFKIGVLKSFVNCTGKRTCFFLFLKSVFIVSSVHFSHLFLVFLLFTFNKLELTEFALLTTLT